MLLFSTILDIEKSLTKDSFIKLVLEWNQGNHFKEAGERTAKAFSWVIINQ